MGGEGWEEKDGRRRMGGEGWEGTDGRVKTPNPST